MISSDTIKPTANDKPQALRHLRADDTKPKAFDFTAGQFKEAHPYRSSFGKGPLQTAQLREMAENKARLAASMAKRLAAATASVKKRGRKATKRAK